MNNTNLMDGITRMYDAKKSYEARQITKLAKDCAIKNELEHLQLSAITDRLYNELALGRSIAHNFLKNGVKFKTNHTQLNFNLGESRTYDGEVQVSLLNDRIAVRFKGTNYSKMLSDERVKNMYSSLSNVVREYLVK